MLNWACHVLCLNFSYISPPSVMGRIMENRTSPTLSAEPLSSPCKANVSEIYAPAKQKHHTGQETHLAKHLKFQNEKLKWNQIFKAFSKDMAPQRKILQF